MFVALVIIITAIVSMVVGFSIQQQLTYGQANMTGENMTVSSNMTTTDTTAVAVPTPELLIQKLNTALDDVLG